MSRQRTNPNGDEKAVELVWEAPLERTKATMYDAVLAEVKRSPGRWARLRILPSESTSYSARKSLTSQYKDDPHWEFKVAKLPPGDDSTGNQRGLYARYRTAEQMKAAK